MSMELYIKRIESFADAFAYPAEAKAEIVEVFQKAFSNPQDLKALQDCVQSYEEDAGRGFSELLALCAAVANETQVNVYTVYMAAMMLFADVSRKHYEAQGLPYELWKNNFADLTYKLQECKLVKGVWGNLRTHVVLSCLRREPFCVWEIAIRARTICKNVCKKRRSPR